MYHIIYSSQAKEPMKLTTLVVLLMQARALNERKHITGALVYAEGEFMQIMEGEEAVVKDLYARVVQDPRHHQVRTLAEGPITARHFAQWSMAFGEVPAAEFEVLRKIAEYQTPAQLAGQLARSETLEEGVVKKMRDLVQEYPKH